MDQSINHCTQFWLDIRRLDPDGVHGYIVSRKLIKYGYQGA